MKLKIESGKSKLKIEKKTWNRHWKLEIKNWNWKLKSEIETENGNIAYMSLFPISKYNSIQFTHKILDLRVDPAQNVTPWPY